MKSAREHSIWSRLGAAVVGVVLLVPALAGAAEDGWTFETTPYLWVAGIEVETGRPPSTPPAVDRYDTKISAGAMLAAQARHGAFGLFVDFAWLRLDTDALNPGPAFSSANLRSDFIHTTAALTYRVPLRGKFHAELLAGARLWHVSEELVYQSGVLPGFAADSDQTWVDPVVGLDARYDLSGRWSLVAKGIVGGFGASADFAAELFAGVNYRITDWCSTTAGYRYLHEKYNHDAFALNLDAQGFVVGFGFHY